MAELLHISGCAGNMSNGSGGNIINELATSPENIEDMMTFVLAQEDTSKKLLVSGVKFE